MNYYYEISDNLELRIWTTEDFEAGKPPFLYQPVHPETREAWSSREELDLFVESWLAKQAEKEETEKALANIAQAIKPYL